MKTMSVIVEAVNTNDLSASRQRYGYNDSRAL